MLASTVWPGLLKVTVVAMAFLISGSAGSPHGIDLLTPNDQTETAYAACTHCHWCQGTEEAALTLIWQLEPGQQPPGLYPISGNVSMLCLSCHDGALAPTPPTSSGWFEGVSTRGLPPRDWSRETDIGHHPYSVPYPVDGDLIFLPLSGDPVCPLPLFGEGPEAPTNRVECPTCHDIHSSEHDFYLRMPMGRSELCLCCHGQMPDLNRHVYLPMQVGRHAVDEVECTACHDY